MTFKYLVLFFCIQSLSLTGQTNNVEVSKGAVYYDVDSIPLYEIYDIDNVKFIKYQNHKNVSTDIEFEGGYAALSAFCDSLYYNRIDYDYIELNARALYSVFFDKELKIKDVRIIKRLAYNNEKYDYDNLMKSILFSTENKWVKTKDLNCDGYLYLGYFNLR